MHSFGFFTLMKSKAIDHFNVSWYYYTLNITSCNQNILEISKFFPLGFFANIKTFSKHILFLQAFMIFVKKKVKFEKKKICLEIGIIVV